MCLLALAATLPLPVNQLQPIPIHVGHHSEQCRGIYIAWYLNGSRGGVYGHDENCQKAKKLGVTVVPKPDTHRNNGNGMQLLDLACFYDHFPIYLIKLGDGISIFIGEKPELQPSRSVINCNFAM